MMTINFSKIRYSRLYIVIITLSFIIYGNSINNEYSLDDNIVVDGVEKVKNGFKAIPEIFTTHHAIDKKQAYGYRPIVSLSFAIEKQFFKRLPEFQTKKQKKIEDKLTQANVSHFFNLLLYALTGIVLFKFLSLIFKEYNTLLPFLITIIFIVHPLHTEPVANIKSRDELLMLLGMLLALIQYLKFVSTSKLKYLFIAGLFIFIALLSKKSAIAMIGIVPVVLYFVKAGWKKILLSTFSVLIFMVLIIAMKKGLLIDGSSRNMKFFENPLFFHGGFLDRVLMGAYCSWFYLKMLIFPKDLSFYYGYNEMPMTNWSYYQIWLAILFYFPIGIYGFMRFLKRDILGLGIVLWFGVMLGVNNVIFPIVGIVADRFTYVFSLGYCIVLVYLLVKIFKIDTNKNVMNVRLSKGFLATISIIVVIYSGRTIARNPDWHDYLHTYKTDIKSVPNSAKAHSLIANTLYGQVVKDRMNPDNQQKVNDIIYHYTRAIEIDSTYLTCLSNLGSAYIDMKADYINGIFYCRKAIEIDPNYIEANFNLATAYDRSSMADSAFKYYLTAIKLTPSNTSFYNTFNTFLTKNNKVFEGINRLKIISTSIPNEKKYLYMNIANLYSLNKLQIDSSIIYFEKAFEEDKTDKRLCSHIVKLLQSSGNQSKAVEYQAKCSMSN